MSSTNDTSDQEPNNNHRAASELEAGSPITPHFEDPKAEDRHSHKSMDLPPSKFAAIKAAIDGIKRAVDGGGGQTSSITQSSAPDSTLPSSAPRAGKASGAPESKLDLRREAAEGIKEVSINTSTPRESLTAPGAELSESHAPREQRFPAENAAQLPDYVQALPEVQAIRATRIASENPIEENNLPKPPSVPCTAPGRTR